MRVAGGHVAFGFDDAGFQQAFLLVGDHAVAAVLHRLAAPPRADFMQNAFILFAHRKARARTVRQIVNLFLNPETVYSGKIGAARTSLARLPIISSSCLIQMVRLAVMRQRGAAHRDRLVHVLLVHFGVMLGALGTDRRLHDMHQAVLCALMRSLRVLRFRVVISLSS